MRACHSDSFANIWRNTGEGHVSLIAQFSGIFEVEHLCHLMSRPDQNALQDFSKSQQTAIFSNLKILQRFQSCEARVLVFQLWVLQHVSATFSIGAAKTGSWVSWQLKTNRKQWWFCWRIIPPDSTWSIELRKLVTVQDRYGGFPPSTVESKSKRPWTFWPRLSGEAMMATYGDPGWIWMVIFGNLAFHLPLSYWC